jgi:hypothetical protein
MKPIDLSNIVRGDDKAHQIADLWHRYDNQRSEIKAEWTEQQKYAFATDTTQGEIDEENWHNSTTVPKLTQIRDNLHSHYLQALMPNDEWLKWYGGDIPSTKKEVAVAIESYMQNKLRMSGFRSLTSRYLYDYIDYGNVFGAPSFEARFKEVGDEKVRAYIGPKGIRISPLDIVFDATAPSFQDTWKIIRSLKTVGELQTLANENPDQSFWTDVINNKLAVKRNISSIKAEDWPKQAQYLADGFGNYSEYYQSNFVEVLEFFGDWHDVDSGEVKTDQRIVVVNRAQVVKEGDIPNWLGKAPIQHAGWRQRPDNLWAMGPLANLVGMQYRLDHLENAKADAFDLAIHPPLAVVGDIEEFSWGPECIVHLDEGGTVTEILKNLNAIITADTQMAMLMELMEEFAGAPRQAMGIRTPGEKTAFEVQTLDNRSNRIFQEKITTFEVEFYEPLINSMFETAKRNLDTNDTIAVMDTDLGARRIMEVTREDITANGTLRPIGARHFAAQAQLLQNLLGIMSSPIGEKIGPHTSGKQLAKLVEDSLGLERHELFRPNVAIIEAQETQRLAAQAEENLAAEDAIDPVIVNEA